ncbi:MAG TPA: DNA mismatch repair protein MutT [Ruminococcaceae bacterium]|nr:DNA mismatch repair protein MutT [Oscillospiraceae bacterium]
MLKYTLCFIVRGKEILMINRQKTSWMGCWNGVGGKLMPNETAYQCIKREIFEETGICVDDIRFKGVVSWTSTDGTSGGMYVFIVYLPDNFNYSTPVKTDEGILDWKELSWIIDDNNIGVAYNIKHFLPEMLAGNYLYEYRCNFDGYNMLTIDKTELNKKYLKEI